MILREMLAQCDRLITERMAERPAERATLGKLRFRLQCADAALLEAEHVLQHAGAAEPSASRPARGGEPVPAGAGGAGAEPPPTVLRVSLGQARNWLGQLSMRSCLDETAHRLVGEIGCNLSTAAQQCQPIADTIEWLRQELDAMRCEHDAAAKQRERFRADLARAVDERDKERGLRVSAECERDEFRVLCDRARALRKHRRAIRKGGAK